MSIPQPMLIPIRITLLKNHRSKIVRNNCQYSKRSTCYPTNKANGEIYVTINPDTTNRDLLPQMIGDRIADGPLSQNGKTEATLKRVLTSEGLPSLYKGKTLSTELEKIVSFTQSKTTVNVSIPIADVIVSDNTGSFVPNQGINYKDKPEQAQ